MKMKLCLILSVSEFEFFTCPLQPLKQLFSKISTGKCLLKYIPNFSPEKLMSDAAPAIFNGLSTIYPAMKNGRCYFHMMKCVKERSFMNFENKRQFMADLDSLSKSTSVKHFDCSVALFLGKFKTHSDKSIVANTHYLEKVWLTDRNRGWHSGLVPGTVTTNNGLEVTNRVFKKDFKGIYIIKLALLIT